jgi:hypothetical protein
VGTKSYAESVSSSQYPIKHPVPAGNAKRKLIIITTIIIIIVNSDNL